MAHLGRCWRPVLNFGARLLQLVGAVRHGILLPVVELLQHHVCAHLFLHLLWLCLSGVSMGVMVVVLCRFRSLVTSLFGYVLDVFFKKVKTGHFYLSASDEVKHVLQVEYSGTDKIPKGPVIFACAPHANQAANQSVSKLPVTLAQCTALTPMSLQFVDPLVVQKCAGRNVSYLIAAASLRRPFVGRCASAMESIGVERPQVAKWVGSTLKTRCCPLWCQPGVPYAGPGLEGCRHHLVQGTLQSQCTTPHLSRREPWLLARVPPSKSNVAPGILWCVRGTLHRPP